MKLDNQLFDNIEKKALLSERRRMHYDLRDSVDEQSQRILNVLEPETIIPIHRHNMTSEVVIILKGKVAEIFYDNDGLETERFVLQPGSDLPGIVVPLSTWHTCQCLEPGSVIFESKATAYDPLTTEEIFKE